MKVIKRLGIFIGILAFALLLLFITFNESRPKGVVSKEADQLAHKMMNALGINFWESTQYVSWTFKGVHHYVWHKAENKVLVSWDNYRVVLLLDQLEESNVYLNDTLITEKKEDFISKAWAYFCNDSFWLIAPFKVFDEGTSRSIVKLENGNEGLLIEYSSGGVTPGDAYLWELNEDGTPLNYKMWVSIIPIGGVTATWENWKHTKTGVILPQNHMLFGKLELTMGEVMTGSTYQEIGLETNPFE